MCEQPILNSTRLRPYNNSILYTKVEKTVIIDPAPRLYPEGTERYKAMVNKSSQPWDKGITHQTPPWNFSWVVPSRLAAMGWPQTPSNIGFLYSEGIHHIVTLSPAMRPPLGDPQQISWTEIAIEEFEPPTQEQIRKFIHICDEVNSKQESIGVQCRMGRGRTGVMAPCYLVHFLDQPPETAISNIRLMRPYSVETMQQERVVKQYHDYIRSL